MSGVLPFGAPESVVYDIVALSGGSGRRLTQHRLPDTLCLATVCLCAADQAPAERLLHAERLCEAQRRS